MTEAAVIPLELSVPKALEMIRSLAEDSANIVIIKHAQMRRNQRGISAHQIELCLKKGVIEEGPFRNNHNHWQVTMRRQAAGEEVICVVAIDWPDRLLVITTFRR